MVHCCTASAVASYTWNCRCQYPCGSSASMPLITDNINTRCQKTLQCNTIIIFILRHFTFWISLSLSGIAMHTHRPQGVNYHGYLQVLKYLLLLYLNRKAYCRQIDKQEVKVIWQKAPHRGPIPRLGVTAGGRKLYHWIPGVGFPISVP